jgi:hypothetical protein
MGTGSLQRKRTNRRDVLARRALRRLIVPVCLVSFAAVAGALLALRGSGPDLFDLTPRIAAFDGYTLVGWHDLERGRRSLKTGGLSAGTMARVLGYMMEGAQPMRDGATAGSFVLLPDRGSGTHPAHRFGDQMIEIRLAAGETVRFSEGRLVWVWGTWKILAGDPGGQVPLYRLDDARVEPADRTEISKYFR